MSFDKSFEHKQKLLDTALAEFSNHGYETASINTILDAAGMSKGQFYYHFKNKEELYLALIDVLIAKKRDFLTSIMQPEDFQGDIFSIFKAQIKYGLAFARQYPAINQFSESFMREKGSPIYKIALAVYSFEDNDIINRLVEAAYQKGDFRTDLPLSFIKKAIGFLFTHVVELAELNNTDEVEDNMNYLIEFMKAGLAKNRMPDRVDF